MSTSPLRLLFTRPLTTLLPCWFALAIPSVSSAGPISLQNATATFSQAGFTPNETIDGVLTTNNGWAIFPDVVSQTIVWETVGDQGSGNDLVTFNLAQNHGAAATLLRFRLSYTTDNRTLFADGLASLGDVTANWTTIDLDTLSATGFGMIGAPTLTELADLSVMASGNDPLVSTYTVAFTTSVTGITGFRLEALEAPSSTSGPGRPGHGNFVLTEFQVDFTPQSVQPVPEPASLTLLGAGLVGLAALRNRKRAGPVSNA